MEETFAQLVQTKRNLLGMSMRELARRTSVDVAYISKIEKGQALNPNFSVVIRIAKELGINMDTLQKVFQLDEDINSIIHTSIQKSVPEVEKEAIQGIVEGLVQVTDNPKFDIEGVGALLQKVYSLHQQKYKIDDTYYVITLEDKDWVHVLETPVVDSQLLSLYHQAMETSEENSFVIKGEILQYPDYFNESRVITLHGLLDKCNSIEEDDDMYIYFSNLKDYSERLLNKIKRL
ncbi:helix-turn-helix domain-containing protein [Aneurinibacillus terranovensis]|uniref:helix-turn-helix domain-containing protein n=1 Tax=Aneurinibacillus terranovensis TaxID=278991 RepID=UPI0003FDC0C9|nr:helix-turn-helix transcriptional regulator [Aneurinibacillus terranovensis]